MTSMVNRDKRKSRSPVATRNLNVHLFPLTHLPLLPSHHTRPRLHALRVKLRLTLPGHFCSPPFRSRGIAGQVEVALVGQNVDSSTKQVLDVGDVVYRDVDT